MTRLNARHALLATSLALAACSAADDAGLWVTVHSDLSGVEALELTIFGEHELLVAKQPIPPDGEEPVLPGLLRIESSGRRESLRLALWALSQQQIVGWATGIAEIAPGRHKDIELTLRAGAPTDADCDGVPDEVDNCPQRSNAGQHDQDGDGTGDACGQPFCPGNLIENGDFNAGVGGWYGYQGELSWTTDAPRDGCGAARLCASVDTTFYLNDVTEPVLAPPEGASYRFSAWVRAADGSAQSVRATLREVLQGGGAPVPVFGNTIGTSGDWQQVVVEHTTGSQVERLTADLKSTAPATGNCIEIDDVCWVRTDNGAGP